MTRRNPPKPICAGYISCYNIGSVKFRKSLKVDNIYAKIRDTAKHTVFFGLSLLMGRLAAFLLLPVYTRYLSKAEYGVVEFATMLFVLTLMLPRSVLIHSLFRSYYDYDDEKNRAMVVSTAFWMIAGTSVILCGIGCLFARPLSMLLLGADYANILRVVFVQGLLGCLVLPLQAVFRARRWSGRYAVAALAGVLIQITVSIYVVVIMGLGPWGPVLGNLAGITVSSALILFMVRDSIKLQFHRTEARKMLKYGLPLAPEAAASFVSRFSDRVFLRWFTTLGVVGVYAVGVKFSFLLQYLIFAPFAFIEPAAIFSAEKDRDAPEFYAKTLTYLVFLGLFMSLGVSALCREVIRIMSAPEFWGAWKVVPLLCITQMLFGIRGSLSQGLLLKRKTGYISLSEGVGMLFNIVSMLVLVRWFGALGAAAATVVTYLVVVLLRLFFNLRYMKIPYEWKRLAKAVLVAAGLYVITLFVTIDNVWLSMAVKFPICLTYPLILFVIGFYEPAELRRGRKILVHLLRRSRAIIVNLLRRGRAVIVNLLRRVGINLSTRDKPQQ